MTAEELREMIDRFMYERTLNPREDRENKYDMATCAWQVFFGQRHKDSVGFPNYEAEGDDWTRAEYYMDTLNDIRKHWRRW